jgi:hypothetical protein
MDDDNFRLLNNVNNREKAFDKGINPEKNDYICMSTIK